MSCLLDQLQKSRVDIRSAMSENKPDETIIIRRDCTIRDILINADGLSGQRVVLLIDCSKGFVEEMKSRWLKIIEKLSYIPSISNISNSILICTPFGSYNYCKLSNTDNYDTFFNQKANISLEDFIYTFGISFAVECRTFYGVIKLLYSIYSILSERQPKLVLPRNNNLWNYCISMNGVFMRDIELWKSDNQYREIKNFPYGWLFAHMIGKHTYPFKKLQKAIDRHTMWIDRCQWK